MHIDIAPETERLVREEISRGHFHSVDELIQAGVQALRERNTPTAKLAAAPASEASSLFELFSPIRGLLTDEEIDRYFGRNPSTGRRVDLA